MIELDCCLQNIVCLFEARQFANLQILFTVLFIHNLYTDFFLIQNKLIHTRNEYLSKLV
jgi:hypothetical protein